MLTNNQQNFIDLTRIKSALMDTLETLPDLENSISLTSYSYILSDILKVRTELEKDLRFIQLQIDVAKSEMTKEELSKLYANYKKA